MKRFPKIFCIVLCAIATASLASCLDSDDDGGIDPVTYKTWLTQMSGSYYGDDSSYKTANKIYFYNDEITGNNKTDSIEGIDVRITTDSTLYVNNIPGTLFSNSIKDNDALKAALDNAPAKTLTGKFLIYNISSPFAYYQIAPQEISYNGLNYDGGSHDVKIQFYTYGGGAFYSATNTRQVQFNFILGDIKVDGNTVESKYGDSWTTDKQGKMQFIVFATR